MTSDPIISWQIDGGKVEKVIDFIFLGSKIIVDGDYSHKIKRFLLLGKKTLTNLDSILKSRDTTLLTTVHIIKAIIFPAVMYRCENWTIKNAERQRIDASNCGAGEDSWSPLDCKEIQPVNPKGNQH